MHQDRNDVQHSTFIRKHLRHSRPSKNACPAIPKGFEKSFSSQSCSTRGAPISATICNKMHESKHVMRKHVRLTMCMHTYIHTYIHKYIHTCMHTYLPFYLRTYIHTCMHACMHRYIHIYIHTYIYTSHGSRTFEVLLADPLSDRLCRRHKLFCFTQVVNGAFAQLLTRHMRLSVVAHNGHLLGTYLDQRCWVLWEMPHFLARDQHWNT